MHILLVNRWYPPHTGFGGVAVYNYYLAHALVRQGHRVTVLAARWSKDIPAPHLDGEVRVVRLFAPEWSRLKRLPVLGRYTRPLQQYLYSLSVSRAIDHMTGVDQPDIIEFAEINAEGYSYLHKTRRAPVVVRCHTPTFVLRQYYTREEMNFDTALTTQMEKFCISTANALTAPSADMAQVIENSCSLNGKTISIIPNALDIRPFTQAGNAQRHPAQEITILHVGRLDRVKGIETLIQAAKTVVMQIPKVRFILLGGGSASYLEKINQLINENGIKQGHFQLLGDVSQDDLIAWYQKADIAVVPTMNYESFSYTVAQAMAAGLPVIASRIGGISETTGSENAAILVEAGNEKLLANALVTLCQNPEMRQNMGKAGLSRAKSYFSDDIVAEKTLALYRTLEGKNS